ncbi:MAG: hypothetical protein H0U76_14605 [Ktedonobacteraceae bacterium]|nr:hypothetical protein [Ktedonobacteraceae bacterium]
MAQTEHKARYQPCSSVVQPSKRRDNSEHQEDFCRHSLTSLQRFNYEFCSKCGFAEFYNSRIGTGTRILDFIGS